MTIYVVAIPYIRQNLACTLICRYGSTFKDENSAKPYGPVSTDKNDIEVQSFKVDGDWSNPISDMSGNAWRLWRNLV